MQLYRGLPIITNKIPVNEREGIPHHLIDFIGLEEEPWRIGKFKNECLRAIQDIHSRGKTPVLVGGTSYYVQSVLFHDGLVDEGAEDASDSLLDDNQPQNGEEREQQAEKWAILDAPAETMMEKLREVDPIMAERWHIKDTRKIRRSLEIYLKTGKPASEIYAEQMRQRQAAINRVEGVAAGQLRYPTLIFWMHAERGKLYKRLDNRVGGMVEQGLISEAQSLFDYLRLQEAQGSSVDMTRGIWVSIGYKEMQPYLAALFAGNDATSEKELEVLKTTGIESVKTSTRQYSARQVQWIRKKLWAALADIGATDRLYVLDGTDPEAWSRCVTEPTERIVQAFLRGDDLPDPKTLSLLAEETLKEREQNHPTGTTTLPAVALRQITCDLCKRTMAGQDQWDIHIRSSNHRRALKAAAKRERDREYLRNRASAEQVDGQQYSPDKVQTHLTAALDAESVR